MGSIRRSVRGLAHFIGDVQRSGATTALRHLGLEQCIGRPAAEALPHLLEALCPPGGRIDEGIARAAFANAIAEFSVQDLPNIESLTLDQWREFFIQFLAQSIELRVMTDLGDSALQLPNDVSSIEAVGEAVHQFILGCVRESIDENLAQFGDVRDDQLRDTVDRTCEGAWGIIESFAGEEATP